MIKATLVGDTQFIARLDQFPQQFHSRLRSVVYRLGLMLQRHVKTKKLSGQVLNVRTNKLRGNINLKFTENLTQITSSVGTNVEYARAHEYGFKGVVSVREHLRRAKEGAMTVRGHSRNVNLPERSFLRSALRDYETTIRADMNKVLVDSVAVANR